MNSRGKVPLYYCNSIELRQCIRTNAFTFTEHRVTFLSMNMLNICYFIFKCWCKSDVSL